MENFRISSKDYTFFVCKNFENYQKIIKKLVNWEFKNFGKIQILEKNTISFSFLHFKKFNNDEKEKIYKKLSFDFLLKLKNSEIRTYLIQQLIKFQNLKNKKVENFYKKIEKELCKNWNEKIELEIEFFKN